MAELDVAVLAFVNGFARRSWTLDHLVALLASTELLKGGVLMTMVWWAWSSRGRARGATGRETVLATLAGAFAATVASRLLQGLLPLRLRPLHEPAVGLRLPYDLDPGTLGGWSSFPSDHAALFFAVATGFFFLSVRVGLFAWLYVLAVICLPRVYLGFHYPSDILGGALLGAACVVAANSLLLRRRLTGPLLTWSRAHPSLFHAGLFVVTLQAVTLFDDVREMGAFAWVVLKARLLALP